MKKLNEMPRMSKQTEKDGKITIEVGKDETWNDIIDEISKIIRNRKDIKKIYVDFRSIFKLGLNSNDYILELCEFVDDIARIFRLTINSVKISCLDPNDQEFGVIIINIQK